MDTKHLVLHAEEKRRN